jgi:hypothetical protein
MTGPWPAAAGVTAAVTGWGRVAVAAVTGWGRVVAR